jgi:hypothetical protein
LRRGDGEDSVLDQHLEDPTGRHEEELVAALTAADVGEDVELVVAAGQLLAQIDPSCARASQYIIDLRGAQGVQVGDNPTMTLNF